MNWPASNVSVLKSLNLYLLRRQIALDDGGQNGSHLSGQHVDDGVHCVEINDLELN